LEKSLGVPVVPTIAVERKGLSELTESIISIATNKHQPSPVAVDYGMTVYEYAKSLETDMTNLGNL